MGGPSSFSLNFGSPSASSAPLRTPVPRWPPHLGAPFPDADARRWVARAHERSRADGALEPPDKRAHSEQAECEVAGVAGSLPRHGSHCSAGAGPMCAEDGRSEA